MQKSMFLPIFFAVLAMLLFGCTEHAGYAQGMKALENNDITMCGQMKEQSEIKECYYTFADGKNDPSLCLKAPDPTACVSDYAGKRQMMSACDVLTDSAQKYSCVARVAGDQTGRSIEEMIADFRTKGASKKCLGQCEKTSSSCELNCKMNENYIPPEEKNGTIIYYTDVEAVKCVNGCKDAYIVCRDDCLSGNGDPYFN